MAGNHNFGGQSEGRSILGSLARGSTTGGAFLGGQVRKHGGQWRIKLSFTRGVSSAHEFCGVCEYKP